MKKYLSFLIAALFSFSAFAEIAIPPGGGSGGGPSLPVSIVNGGTGQTTAPAAFQAINSGIKIDPRQYGAACAGTTWSGGVPSEVGSNDDTLGFELAEFVAAATGGSVIVPDGCWVANLQMLSGISLVGENWAPNYGYDYGTGAIGPTLALTPGSGYTNGTYLLQAVGAESGCTVGNNNCFNLGNKTGGSSTSVTVGTGSQTFTTATSLGYAANAPVLIYDNSTVSGGSPTNWMYGLVVSDSGTTLIVNITQTGGSGTITTWNVASPSTVVVSGGGLSTYSLANNGYGYGSATTVPVPSSAGSGSGGSISVYVRPNSQPFGKPVLYVRGTPTYGINVNGSETVALTGFEINATSNSGAFGSTSCVGDNTASTGYGGKIWINNMSFKGCLYGFQGSSGCYDYLVSQNTDYGANNTGIGGCFSDLLTNGDTFASDTYGIVGSGGGFARVSNDRFEYSYEGIVPSSSHPFLEWSIVNTQFDHMNTCAISSGGTWNNITMTGGALKAGGVDGSLTVTGTASGNESVVNLAINSAISTINNGAAVTSPFYYGKTQYGTSTSSFTLTSAIIGNQTFTTSTSLGLTANTPVMIYATGGNYLDNMYGTVVSDTGTSLVVNVLQYNGSGTFASWNITAPFTVKVGSVGGTTEANGTWNFSVIDNTHIALQGTAYVNAYTSGGYGGVQGFDSNICLNGTNSQNGGLTLSNVGYYSSSALGQVPAPAFVWEATTSGANNNYLAFTGSPAQQAGSGVTINYNAFTLGFENEIVSAPTIYKRDVLGLPVIDTNNTTLSQSSSGNVGIGTRTPAASFDVSQRTDAIILPVGPTTAEPGTPAVGMIRYDNTLNAFTGYSSAGWGALGNVTPSSTNTFTNKTFDTGATGNVFKINGDQITAVSGNTATVATSSGTLTNGHCVSIDGSGNFVDAGGACTTGGGGGTVASSTIGQFSVYTGTTTVSGSTKLTTANVGILVPLAIGNAIMNAGGL